MRIVWKDSNVREKKPVKYRKHYVSGYKDGWVIDIPDDYNIYKSHYCALNAIDKSIDGIYAKGNEKRKRCGIEVIGQKEKGV